MPRGIIARPAQDQSQAPPQHFMMEVTIARWYLPWLILKHLKQAGVPRYFWPYLLWKAYAGKVKH